jgi:hypothetical protein
MLSGQIVHGNMDVQAFHGQSSSMTEQAGVQTGVQGLPPQQFSVRKASSSFIAEKLAV